MNKLLKYIAAAVFFCGNLFSQPAMADEGMWMVGHLPAKTDSLLRELGLELTPEQLYSEDGPSLNNAIVMFGGFCSGVVVSPDGLVFTNHHCGYGSIQEHSSTKHDYLKYGFVAKNYAEELPNEDLFVAFHLKTVDVTDYILDGISDTVTYEQRERIIDGLSAELCKIVDYSAKGIFSEVNPFYKGSKYYLSVYQRFDDVRLVFAPPSCLGKFGGDTDNWVWPRHTCDFSVFRVYADKNNQPAEYSEDNVPYHPVSYAHVSTQGIYDGSYAMTLGYPGSTDRYLSSFGIENTMKNENDVRYKARTVKLDVLNEFMRADDAIRIMYASKHAHSSNYWKFSHAQNIALDNLKVLDEKRALEAEVNKWLNANKQNYSKSVGVLDTLKNYYEKTSAINHDLSLWMECVYNGSDILNFIIGAMNGRVPEGEGAIAAAVEKAYKDIDIDVDKKMFKELYKFYHNNAILLADSDRCTPEQIDTRIDELYSKSIFARPDDLAKVSGLEDVANDPFFDLAVASLVKYRSLRIERSAYNINEYERLLGDAIREMNHDKDFYPDANFTLRLSYGLCKPINFAPGTTGLKEEATNLITSPEAFLNKVKLGETSDDKNIQYDYQVIPPVLKWMKSGKFSKRYLDKQTGKLPLCFLTTNDITGGNSGSGMFNGKGHLIGLAFDGNEEAMSGDIKFDTNLQRCIGVDIRYVLSVIEDYSKAKRLINELTIE